MLIAILLSVHVSMSAQVMHCSSQECQVIDFVPDKPLPPLAIFVFVTLPDELQDQYKSRVEHVCW